MKISLEIDAFPPTPRSGRRRRGRSIRVRTSRRHNTSTRCSARANGFCGGASRRARQRDLFRLEVLQPNASSRAQAVPRLFDPTQEAGVMFETVFEPILL